MEQFLKVGVITQTHGLKGEFKIYPTTDSPERFLDITRVYVGEEKQKETLTGVRFFKQFVIAGLKGKNTIEEAEKLKGKELFVERADGAPLRENEYYIADLIGMKVEDREKGFLGELTDVMETGANDVYVVTSEKYGEILIPAIRQCIKKVDIEQGIMQVELLPGLIGEA